MNMLYGAYTVVEINIWSLLILYVCPLTKKWSVYNFNGRFIWTVRDRITKKIQKNAFQESYKLICILMSDISIWSAINQQDFWLPGVFYTGKELRLRALSYGSFPLSGTVRYSTVRYAIMSVSIVRSCEWYQNSEPYRTTFLVPFRWGT